MCPPHVMYHMSIVSQHLHAPEFKWSISILWPIWWWHTTLCYATQSRRCAHKQAPSCGFCMCACICICICICISICICCCCCCCCCCCRCSCYETTCRFLTCWMVCLPQDGRDFNVNDNNCVIVSAAPGIVSDMCTKGQENSTFQSCSNNKTVTRSSNADCAVKVRQGEVYREGKTDGRKQTRGGVTRSKSHSPSCSQKGLVCGVWNSDLDYQHFPCFSCCCPSWWGCCCYRCCLCSCCFVFLSLLLVLVL